jgi:hypothetical protein
VDAASNAYIIGNTDSSDFPILYPLWPNGFAPYGGFIAKIASTSNTPAYTWAGTDIMAQPLDTAATESRPVTLTFDNVTTAGNTSLTTSTSGPPSPTGFELGVPPTYYDITTTAAFNGNVQVCVDYTNVSYENEANLTLFHYDGYAPDPDTVPTTFHDMVANIICGEVDSLSPFIVAEEMDTPPTLREIAAPVDPVLVGTSISASTSFTDPNVANTHTATWNWGDNSTTSGTVTEANGSGSVTNSHTYTSPGVYTVQLTVTDSANLSGSATYEYVVVYDPGGGRVTGSGWIDSPPGAYIPNSTLIGEAKFGFHAKYRPGGQTPDGKTKFNLRVADLDFESQAYQWLVISGYRAQARGTGTIDGTGSYSFLITVIDGQAPGGGGVDKFRIQIRNTANNAIIYDSQPGASDNQDPTTPLDEGSIVIHR